MTRGVGRPTSYDPKYCKVAVDALRKGHSVAGVAGKIGVARSTVYLWIDTHPEFSDAVKAGQAAAALWWENKLIEVAGGGDGNVTACIFGLKNRADREWREKSTVAHADADAPGEKPAGTSAAELLLEHLAKLA